MRIGLMLAALGRGGAGGHTLGLEDPDPLADTQQRILRKEHGGG